MQVKTGFVNIYNKIAPVYDNKYSSSCIFATNLVLKMLAEQVYKPSVLLDIGCGTGTLLEKIIDHKLANITYGIDPAYGMLSVAKNKLPQTTFFLGASESLPFSDESIDTVVSTVSFSHWYDKKSSLEEISRVLTPGGFALIVEHDMPTFMQKSLLRLIRRLPEFISLHTVKEMIAKIPTLTPYAIEIVNKFLVIYVRKDFRRQKDD
jgi:ubiquinone/menaquinone biosynthesis C-methylase UbiE